MSDGIGKAKTMIQAGRVSEAMDTLRQAAQRGEREAQFQLGLIYYRSQAVAGDLDAAWEYFEAADNEGHIRASYYIGRICTYYAEHGIAMPSQNERLTPAQTETEWHEAAAEWYRRSADRGFHAAMARLGVNYLYGIGVPQSKKKAYEYFISAKNAGNFYAHAKLIRFLFSFNKGISGFFAAFYEIFWAVAAVLSFSMRRTEDHTDKVKERFLA